MKKIQLTRDQMVEQLLPDDKDLKRASDLQYNTSFGRWSFYGSGAPFTCSATAMARKIKDDAKLVRRSLAVLACWGTRDYTGYSAGVPKKENVWDPFESRLRERGFTWAQISTLESRGRDVAKMLDTSGSYPVLKRA